MLPCNGLAHVVLVGPVVQFAKSWLDDLVLRFDQLRLHAKVLVIRQLEQGDEALGPGRARHDVLDLE